MRGLAELKKLSQTFGKANDIEEVLDILLVHALSITGATDAIVILVEQESPTGHIAARRGVQPQSERNVDHHFLLDVLKADEIIEVTDPQLALGLFGAELPDEPALTVVPLITQNATEGILVLQTRLQDDEARYALGILAYLAGDTIRAYPKLPPIDNGNAFYWTPSGNSAGRSPRPSISTSSSPTR